MWEPTDSFAYRRQRQGAGKARRPWWIPPSGRVGGGVRNSFLLSNKEQSVPGRWQPLPSSPARPGRKQRVSILERRILFWQIFRLKSACQLRPQPVPLPPATLPPLRPNGSGCEGFLGNIWSGHCQLLRPRPASSPSDSRSCKSCRSRGDSEDRSGLCWGGAGRQAEASGTARLLLTTLSFPGATLRRLLGLCMRSCFQRGHGVQGGRLRAACPAKPSVFTHVGACSCQDFPTSPTSPSGPFPRTRVFSQVSHPLSAATELGTSTVSRVSLCVSSRSAKGHGSDEDF